MVRLEAMALVSAVSIRAKIIAAFAVLLACLGGLALISHDRLTAANTAVVDVRDNQLPSVLLLGEMSDACQQFRLLEAGYALGVDPAGKRRDEAAMAAVRVEASKSLKTYYPLAGAGVERRMADEVGRRWRDYLALHDRFMAAARQDARAVPADLYHGEMEIEFGQFQSALQLLIRFNVREATDGAATAATVTRSAAIWILAMISLKVVLCIGIGCSLVCGVAIPITRMTEAMRRLARRDMTAEIPGLTRVDEIGEMAGAVQVFKEGLVAADRLNAERDTARAREMQHLRQLVNGTFEGILIHRDGTVLSVNMALCQLIGRPEEELCGHSVLEFLAPGSAELSRQRLRRHALEPAELELLRADGTVIPVEVSVAACRIRWG